GGEDTVVVARERTAERIEREGIEVRSVRLGDFDARPRVVSSLEEPADVLLVATKSTGLSAGLERIRSEPRLVVPLLNGLDHMALLRERFPRVAAGTIRIESRSSEPGVILETGPFLRVDLASDDPTLHDSLEQLAVALGRAKVPAEIGPGQGQLLWWKVGSAHTAASRGSRGHRPAALLARRRPRPSAALAGAVYGLRQRLLAYRVDDLYHPLLDAVLVHTAAQHPELPRHPAVGLQHHPRE